MCTREHRCRFPAVAPRCPRHPTLGSRRLDTAVACAATAVSTTARPRTTDGRTAFSDQSTLSRSRHEPTRSHHNERHFSDVLHRQKLVNTTSHYPQTPAHERAIPHASEPCPAFNAPSSPVFMMAACMRILIRISGRDSLAYQPRPNSRSVACNPIDMHLHPPLQQAPRLGIIRGWKASHLSSRVSHVAHHPFPLKGPGHCLRANTCRPSRLPSPVRARCVSL